MTVEKDMRPVIRGFLEKHFQRVQLRDEDDIFALGFVNSLFALQLVMFVEHEFGISIDDEDLEIENFTSVNAITKLVERKILHAR